MQGPLFIEPAFDEVEEAPTILESDQEAFDSCGTCPDCITMLGLGRVAVRRDIQPTTLGELDAALRKNSLSVRSRQIYQGNI